jgi:glycosyltransferase involved in cell wall biosynthesis
MNRKVPLTIGYDAHAIVALNKGGGKGTQLRNLLGSHINTFKGFASKSEVRSDLPIVTRGCNEYVIWQQSTLIRMLWQAQLDLFVAPYNTAPLFIPKKTKLILVLHDLIPFENFRRCSLRLRALLHVWRFLIPRNVARAFVVLTVSEYSREQILRRFPNTLVEVIYCTIGESWFLESNAMPVSERDNYVLMVTSTEPHRNVDRALRAYAQYVVSAGERPAQLRIAGVSGKAHLIHGVLRDLGLVSQVIVEPYLSEAAMQERFRRAKAVIMPSLFEGFGIPVLEGMASGTPVICSNAASLPEIGGDAAAYFNPYDVDDMARTVFSVLSDVDLQLKMSERGIVRARLFHPKKIEERVEEFWTSIAE